MDHNNSDDFQQPFVQEVDSPQTYEKMIELYRFITIEKVIILILLVFGLKYAYDHRTEQVKDSGVVIYHGRDQVFYQGTTLYYRYKRGDLKLYHKRADFEEETDAYIQYQAWLTGSLRSIHGLDFQPRVDFDYDTVAKAFITTPDPSSIKFTTIITLPFFWTTLFGVILIVEPRVALILYMPIALLPARGKGIPDLPQYDPDVNYKFWGQVLLVISVLLLIPFGDQLVAVLRKLFS